MHAILTVANKEFHDGLRNRWVMSISIIFAFLATVTALFKLIEIYSVKMPQPGSLHGILKALNEGDRDKAMEYYARLVRLWRNCDPELIPMREEARRNLNRLLVESTREPAN